MKDLKSDTIIPLFERKRSGSRCAPSSFHPFEGFISHIAGRVVRWFIYNNDFYVKDINTGEYFHVILHPGWADYSNKRAVQLIPVVSIL